MSAKAASVSTVKRYRSSGTVIIRFVARRTIRSATFVALALGGFVASKTIGYADLYPTVQDRMSSAAIYLNNVGLKVLFGTPHHLETVSGYASWYALTIGVLLGSIWAYLIATKTFRGEEAAGRWELLLSSKTTSRRAAASALAGLGISLALFYAITAATFIAIGQVHAVGYTAGPALFFALSACMGAVMFMAVGALASQIMPTRARAAGLATTIFGVSFLVRATADIAGWQWLLDLSPLGWIEQLQPLYGPQPLWLVPIMSFIAVMVTAAIFLAGRRDMGASLLADHDTAKPRTRLLGSPLAVAIRLTRATTLGWLFGIAAMSAFFGALTKTATRVFNDSSSAQHLLNKLAHSAQDASAKAFLGIVFLILMLVVMSYAASAAGAMREDEASGYLENLLVRPLGRQRWLWGRVMLTVIVVCMACVLVAVVAWASMLGQHLEIAFHTLLSAGLNMLAPALLTLGTGIFALGFLPRLTTVIAYGLIVWSFLLEMISSGLNLNHWLLDTSVFTHVASAPAVDPHWNTNWALIGVAVVLAMLGAWRFGRRDLASE